MLQRAVGAAVAAALLFGVALIPVALWPDCRAAPWKCLRPGSGRALTTEAPSSPCTTSPHAPPNRRLSSPVDFIVRLWGQTYPMTAVWNETVHRYLGHAHAETQESLFQDLKQVWGAGAPGGRTPKVMVDLGSVALQGYYRNVSDSLLWLEYFDGPGAEVVAVDIARDFAVDLQRRFEYDYAATRARKRAFHAKVGNEMGPLTPGSPHWIPLGEEYTLTGPWWDDPAMQREVEALERAGHPDHALRVTQARVRGTATGPAWPLAHSVDALSAAEAGRPFVGTVTVDYVWETLLRGRAVDFLKIDIDAPFHTLLDGMRGLLARGGARAISWEVDDSWFFHGGRVHFINRQHNNAPRAANRTQAVHALARAVAPYGYRTFLKMMCDPHCAVSPSTRYCATGLLPVLLDSALSLEAMQLPQDLLLLRLPDAELDHLLSLSLCQRPRARTAGPEHGAEASGLDPPKSRRRMPRTRRRPGAAKRT